MTMKSLPGYLELIMKIPIMMLTFCIKLSKKKDVAEDTIKAKLVNDDLFEKNYIMVKEKILTDMIIIETAEAGNNFIFNIDAHISFISLVVLRLFDCDYLMTYSSYEKINENIIDEMKKKWGLITVRDGIKIIIDLLRRFNKIYGDN